ncbi:hypothetical protein GGF32_008124 [Allomyces javanicus]|nr:hypothetical protein GGF32_008124 [Allomyces javanicus]
MVQSLNTAGITTFFRVLVSPRLARPAISVPDVTAINYAQLKDAGHAAIVFDKDNCLTAPYETSIHPPFQKAFDECLRVFGRDKVAVYSNSAGTPDDPAGQMATKIEQSLGVPVLRHQQKKPAGGKSIPKHFAVPPNQVVFVGDRVLTDVVFANRNGFTSIHTYRIVTEKGDNPMALWIRRMENWWLYGNGKPGASKDS